MARYWLGSLTGLLLVGCSSSLSSAPPTYTKDIRPIFEKRCSNCHNANWAGKNWMNYDEAYANREKIKDRVSVKKNMPPGTDMPQKERDLVESWVNTGAKK